MQSPNPDAAPSEITSNVRAAVSRSIEALRAATHPTLTALLCSSACAPVIAAALGTGAVPAALLGALGGIGGGALTNVVSGLIDRLRRETNDDLDESAISLALAERIDEIAAADTEESAMLRADVAAVLEATNAARIAVETAIQTGDEQLLTKITAELEQQAASFSEYRGLLTEVRDTTRQVLDDLRRMHTLQHRHGQQMIVLLTRILNRIPAQRERARDASGSETPTEPPYRGLMPYRDDQTALFFGRERATSALLGKAAACATTGSPLVVTGASGAGKSSLLRAGFLPAIAAGGLQVKGSEVWPLVYLTPGESPFDALGVELAKIDRSDGNAVSRALADDPERAHLQVRQRIPPHDGDEPARLVLVIDQFEEVFTSAGEEQRDAFVAAVMSIAKGNGSPTALVVLGLRGDFVDRCAPYEELVTALQDNAFVVGPMTDAELRQTITGPAEFTGLKLDEGLDDDILADLRSASDGPGFGPAALPLLSQTMYRIWEKRDGDKLTRRAYTSFGGISNAVASSAEEVYSGLDESSQRIARELFTRMIVASRDGGLAKRTIQRKQLDELGAGYQKVLKDFTGARLLVAEEETVEIAHEALLTYWSRLRGWMEEDRESLVLRSELIKDAEEWNRNGRDPSFLYRGKRFATVEHERYYRWQAHQEQFPPPGRLALEFLAAARLQERRRRRARRGLVAGIAGVLALVVIAVGAVFLSNQRVIDQQGFQISTRLAETSRDLAETDGPLAQLLAAAAWKVRETDEAWAAMANAVDQPGTGAIADGYDVSSIGMAISADGSTLAHLDGNGSLVFRDIETQEIRRMSEEFEGSPSSVLLNEDASVAVVGEAQKITVLDSYTGDVMAELAGSAELEPRLALSADETRLAAIYGLNAVRVWDFATFEPLSTIELGPRPTSVSFGASADEILIGDESGRVTTWDAASMSEVRSTTLRGAVQSIEPMPGDGDRYLVCAEQCGVLALENGSLQDIFGTFLSAAVSPDGNYIAALHLEGDFGVWTADTFAFVGMIPAEGSSIDIEFGPDNRTLYSQSSGALVSWDLDRLRAVSTYETGRWTMDLEYSADGSRLVNTGESPVQVWDAAGSDLELVTEVPELYGNDSAISPDGRTAATTDGDSGGADIAIWDLDSGEVLRTLKGHSSYVTGLDFSADGSMLVSGEGPNPEAAHDAGAEMSELRVWDLETGASTVIPLGEEHAPVAIDLRPDDRAVAVVDEAGDITVWEVETGELRHSLETGETDAVQVTYSPDGSKLEVGIVNGLLSWSPDADRVERIGLGDEMGFVHRFAYSSDGRFVAQSVWGALGGGNEVIVSDLDRDEIVYTIPIWTYPSEIVFAPDGRTLALTIGENRMQVYDLSFLDDPYAAVCEQAGRDLTEEEWRTYLPGIPPGSIDICP